MEKTPRGWTRFVSWSLRGPWKGYIVHAEVTGYQFGNENLSAAMKEARSG